jgi:hypothetical protein
VESITKTIGQIQRDCYGTSSGWVICIYVEGMWNFKVRMLESPDLYSFTNKTNISLNEAKAMDDFHENFQLPLTHEAFQPYRALIMEIENLEITPKPDKWTYIWGSS